MICPFRDSGVCVDENCALYVKEYKCCSIKYPVIRDINKKAEFEESRARFREHYRRLDR